MAYVHPAPTVVINQPTTLVAQQTTVVGKVFPTTWMTPWTACMDDCESCLLSFLCPCIQFGRVHAALSMPPTGLDPSSAANQQCFDCTCQCCLWALVAYFLGPIGTCWIGCGTRQHLRNRYNIRDGDCADGSTDMLMHLCCWSCALAQEWRELKLRKDQVMNYTIHQAGITLIQQQPQQIMMVPPPQPGVVLVQPQPQPQYYAQHQQPYGQQPQYAYGQPQYSQYPPPPQYSAPPQQIMR